MHPAYAHCQNLVRTTDKDRFLAALFLPEAIRPHAFALYAFNVEIGSIREKSREPLAGEVRLQWWRDALAGNAAGGVSAHPVAAALSETIELHNLPLPLFQRMIEAREFDLYDDPMPSMDVFEAYVRLTASSLFDLTGMLASGVSTAMATAAGHAGLAFGITGLLRALPLHASRGQLYLPGDVLARHDADPLSILRGEATPQILNALAELRGKARDHFREASRLLAELPREVQAAFLPLVLTDAYLTQMDRRDYDPFKTPVEIAQWRRQWKLWRASRRAP